MNENRVVIDITTLQKWRRFPVGIVRTQLEFTKYSLLKIENIGFVAFDDSKSVLSHVNKNDVIALLDEYETESWPSNSPISVKFSSEKSRKLQEIYNMIKQKDYLRLSKIIYSKLPVKIRSVMREVLEPVLRKRLERVKEKEQTIQEHLFRPESVIARNNNSVLFSTDTLICMGLDWDFSNYSLLLEMKKLYGFKVVTCFYDSIPFSYPELVHSDYFGKVFFSHMYKLNYLSDKVFCISNFSKNCFETISKENGFAYLPILKTIYLGDNVKALEINNGKTDGTNYILYVSTIEARKNHILLLRVWKELIKKYGEKTPKLILVGMKGWGVDEFYDEYNNSSLKKYIEIRSNVSDIELSQLYSQSKFCVFPSIVEGWGLGAAESLRYGKACLISDCEALSEATQGVMPALPNDTEAWLNAITSLLEEPQRLVELELKITNEFTPRSWNEFCSDFHQFIAEK